MPAKPVSEEPHVDLERWGILVDGWGDPRLVGSPLGTTRGRISSAVEAFDLHAMAATTVSGRSYRLVGDGDWENALLIVVALQGGIPARFGRWMSVEELALHVSAPTPGGMN